ncbi:hypothetical protein ACHAXH_005341, partial [Discostella pseudostelligera]
MKFAYCLTIKNLALNLLLAANSMIGIGMMMVAADDAKAGRDLEASCALTAAYHPDYSLTWSQGKCDLTITCYSPSYATELACCKAEYANQESGYCISQLDNLPTSSPTKKGGPDAWYPDWSLQWNEGKCINTVPRPNNANPIFASQLACCKSAYAGQSSNACIAALANPPTSGPTKLGGPDAWYPDYSLAWTDGKCINTVPVPSGRPIYTTQLACCKGAYGGQLSNACIQSMVNPPTFSPTTPGGPNAYYPDYSLAWTDGKCINTVPVPSGRPIYTTQLACCTGAYGGQVSKACMNAIPRPQTNRPTTTATAIPSSLLLTIAPTSASPTTVPTSNPSTANPSTATPTQAPTATPTEPPTAIPTEPPTAIPTEPPTAIPTEAPTATPTQAPTAIPTEAPTATPTEAPTATPTIACFPGKTNLQDAVNTYIGKDCTNNPSDADCVNLSEAWGSPIGNWCTSLITDMSHLFAGTSFNEDISGWNVASVTDMAYMFNDASVFNQNITKWTVASVTNMDNMFAGASAFNQNIGEWNVESVTNMAYMFAGASAFNQDISGWNVALVTNMNGMFFGASA